MKVYGKGQGPIDVRGWRRNHEEVIFELSTDEWVQLHWVKEGCGQLWRSKWIQGRGNSCAKTLGQEVAWCLGGSERGYDTRLGRPMRNIQSCRVLKTMLKNLVFTPKNELLKLIEGYSLFVHILHSMVREKKKMRFKYLIFFWYLYWSSFPLVI